MVDRDTGGREDGLGKVVSPRESVGIHRNLERVAPSATHAGYTSFVRAGNPAGFPAQQRVRAAGRQCEIERSTRGTSTPTSRKGLLDSCGLSPPLLRLGARPRLPNRGQVGLTAQPEEL